ncbi:OmpA family protein [Flavobacterium sp. GCM10023249]|uniref:OmpA family protein n=1 Tax=unclassified Flavobacterium TaxID=196869 RepID=UPI003619AFBD
MSKQTTYILGIILTLVIGAFFYSKFCCLECHQKKEEATITTSEAKIELPNNQLELISKDFNYRSKNNFNFALESFKTSLPIHKDINSGIEKLKLYFETNPNKRLTITGYALKSEENHSAFPNLAFARAYFVKKYFISKGISSNRFEIDGKIVNSWTIQSDTISGPINYSITDNQITAKAQDWNAIKDTINGNPLLLYFNPNQSEIALTNDERQRIADFAEYLDNVPDAVIVCTGYTDNTGNKYQNIQLGQDRADFVKAYLVQNGISEKRIQAFSKGQDDPIADNLTPEGKAKNRRTVITLK